MFPSKGIDVKKDVITSFPSISASTIYRTMNSCLMLSLPIPYSVYVSCDAVAHVATIRAPKRINSLCKMDATTIRKLHFLMVARHWLAKECVMPVRNRMSAMCKK